MSELVKTLIYFICPYWCSYQQSSFHFILKVIVNKVWTRFESDSSLFPFMNMKDINTWQTPKKNFALAWFEWTSNFVIRCVVNEFQSTSRTKYENVMTTQTWFSHHLDKAKSWTSFLFYDISETQHGKLFRNGQHGNGTLLKTS